MARQKTLEKKAEEHGATLDWSDCSVNVDAPVGKVWSANRASTLAVAFAEPDGSESWKPHAFADLIESMDYGVEDAPIGYEGWWGVMTEDGVVEATP